MTIEQFLSEALHTGPPKKPNFFKYIGGGVLIGLNLIKELLQGLISKEKKMSQKLSDLALLFMVIWFGVNYPYDIKDMSGMVFPVIAFVGNLLILCISFLTLLRVYLIFSREDRFVRNIKKQYDSSNPFSGQEIVTAAEILRNWKSIGYDKGIKKYGKRIVDLLLVAGGIHPFLNSKNKLTMQRLVSIKSIEEDREAGWEE